MICTTKIIHINSNAFISNTYLAYNTDLFSFEDKTTFALFVKNEIVKLSMQFV